MGQHLLNIANPLRTAVSPDMTVTVSVGAPQHLLILSNSAALVNSFLKFFAIFG